MNTYSGSTSEGFLPAMMPATGTAATTFAPAPEDPSATFTDVLQLQQGGVFVATAPGLAASGTAGLPFVATQQSPLSHASSPPVAGSVPASVTVPVAPPVTTTAAPAFFTPAVTSATPLTWTTAGTPASLAVAPAAVLNNNLLDPSETSASHDAASANAPLPSFGPAAGSLSLPTSPATAAIMTTTPDTSLSDPSETAAPTLSFLALVTHRDPVATLGTAAQSNAPTTNATPALPTPIPVTAANASDGSEPLTLSQYLWLSQSAPATATAAPSKPSPMASQTVMSSLSENTTSSDTKAAAGQPASPLTWLAKPAWAPMTSVPARVSAGQTSASSTPASTASGFSANTTVDTDNTGALIAATVFGNNAPTAPAPGAMTKSKASPQSDAGGASASTAISGSPLATIMAQAAILAASSPNNPPVTTTTPSAPSIATAATAVTVAAGVASAISGTPRLATYSQPSPTTASAEKKSVATPSERSSLPSVTARNTSDGTPSGLLEAAFAASLNTAFNQPLTTGSAALKTASASLTSSPVGGAGMANGKKTPDMNSTLDLPATVVSTGTNPLVTRTSADLHIQLGTNADFHHALDQVMHVASLSNLSRVTPPLRVAIEIQTPPGAIVNVYVSRQPDSSYRAQLSTSDPVALAWVQDQVGSLKASTDTGTSIRWSPAQLETGTASTSGAGSSGSDRDLNWNRGGQQGQNGYQQDERDARPQPEYAESDEPETAGLFAAAVGGAA